MTDLVQWLREQIAEDRTTALDCAGAPWVNDVTAMVHVDPIAIRENKWGLGHLGYVASADNSPIGDAYRAHIVRHDPRDVLAQCEAHTAILDRVEAALRQPDSAWDVGYAVLHALALAYQHRPGYRPEWTP
jgi:hypothetical protein